MNRLDSIEERMKQKYGAIADGISDSAIQLQATSDVSYLISILERYETTLQKITHTTTHMQAKFFAQESLKEGNS